MKLGDVVKQTGLTKRTIYFYIEEHFLNPEINPANGYYNFSKEDVERLNVLKQLRKADFSIKDIQAMLKHPTTAYLYVQKQIETLKKERELLNQKIIGLKNLHDRLPLLVSDETFSDAVFHTDFPDNQVTVADDGEGDARLISLYLWGPFLKDTPMTEYRQFLWSKLVAEAGKSSSAALETLKAYLYSLSAEELDEEFNQRTQHIQQIAGLTEHTIPDFLARARRYLKKISCDPAFTVSWKKNYANLTLPTTTLYDSDFNTLAAELSPCFSIYYENIHKCCDQIYQWLNSEEGSQVKSDLLKNLDGYLDLCIDHHAQIGALFGVGVLE
ncbi:MAG: MerR family transcriptional regulator [Faecalicatena sp.]|uniref:MerR family transcriptional regulator n=1 Tax=Faecalicatena sp. TaxID=2005360 RepID=UPI002585CB70|nr:MerR family transcriptional regulator [Faecalicatena sp.]MCI6465764.1 MerR family transcriptional regulator [Faecalicatena sp.]MDY5618822.1 MerR family transcriptional regulator [Lachnospiraceae bacterium]